MSETNAPPPERPYNLARVQAVPWLLFILAFAAAVWFAWQAYGPEPEPEADPVPVALAALQQQGRLTVFSAEIAPVVVARDSRLFGLAETRQTAMIPARVEYALDLSALDWRSLSWDAESRVLSVMLPPLTVGRVNLDEARAQYLRDGLWISDTARDALDRQNTKLAEQLAQQRAHDYIYIEMAQTAAKDAVLRNLAIPLEVAGFGTVTLEIRHDGQPAPSEEPAKSD